MLYFQLGSEKLFCGFYHFRFQPASDFQLGFPVTLLHSLGTDHRLWKYQIPAFSKFTDCILAPDSRGHGLSTYNTNIGLNEWVEDTKALLDRLDIQSTVLCGVSLGGVEALAFALSYPERVRALVVADTFSSVPKEQVESKIQATAGLAEKEGMHVYANSYLNVTITGSETAQKIRPELYSAIAEMSLDVYKKSAEVCFRVDLDTKLAKIQVPTLVLIGEQDFKTPIDMAQKLVGSIKNSRLEIVPSAGHLSNIDNPNDFNSKVEAFLRTI